LPDNNPKTVNGQVWGDYPITHLSAHIEHDAPEWGFVIWTPHDELHAADKVPRKTRNFSKNSTGYYWTRRVQRNQPYRHMINWCA